MGIKLCVCKFRKDSYSRVIDSFALFYNHEKREIPSTNKV